MAAQVEGHCRPAVIDGRLVRNHDVPAQDALDVPPDDDVLLR